MQYRVYFTLPDGREGTADYTATDPKTFRLLGQEAISRRRHTWLIAHPGVTIRAKWFKMLMIMEVESGKIVFPAAVQQRSKD